MKTTLFLPGILLLFTGAAATAQENIIEEDIEDFSYDEDKHFLIINASKDYDNALTVAKEASEKLQLEIDLRDLQPHEENGLTWSKEDCEGNGGWEYPCYVYRGREADKNYVSIEWSTDYPGFTEGFYIVMISNQSERNEAMVKLLNKAKEYYTDAYIKTTEIYMGCMH